MTPAERQRIHFSVRAVLWHIVGGCNHCQAGLKALHQAYPELEMFERFGRFAWELDAEHLAAIETDFAVAQQLSRGREEASDG